MYFNYLLFVGACALVISVAQFQCYEFSACGLEGANALNGGAAWGARVRGFSMVSGIILTVFY